uniref:Putative tetrahydromethanopterin biosynthesis protein n=1 Tax=uncultured bacterium BAC10-10 TaxID=333372 RepID=Q4JIP6_9BACT|nr:putative tetrahydromethanopterin biosynthesis protein [uncultured bacterium BAC10-10]
MRPPIIGWDVGGANVKAALITDSHQNPSAVLERPFALWRDPTRLPEVLAEVAGRLGIEHRASAMAVTMTAELADCFSTKREGVASVLDAFCAAFPGLEPWIYGVDGRFRTVGQAREESHVVAAANWMASATWVARSTADALFLDVGSTTTDIIPIVSGGVDVRGRTDLARLESGELVYTGALRTPVAAIVRAVPVQGSRCRVAAEYFALSADVYRWLGRIDEQGYTCETPDGRGRSRREAGIRLARVVCADMDMLGPDEITAIAEHVARAQVRQVASAIRRVMRRLGPKCPRVAVLAGQGRFIAQAAAETMRLATRDLASEAGSAAARAAPAAAVAYLLAESPDV